jgi:hypothetical protein
VEVCLEVVTRRFSVSSGPGYVVSTWFGGVSPVGAVVVGEGGWSLPPRPVAASNCDAAGGAGRASAALERRLLNLITQDDNFNSCAREGCDKRVGMI